MAPGCIQWWFLPIVLAGGAAYDQWSEPGSRQENAMTTLETDLHVRVWGVGHAERVVLLHGSNVPDPERIWHAQRPLADEFEALVVDRRGFGQSPDATAPLTWDGEVADVLALVGERAHVVGHSYGGVIALALAGRFPERVRSLVTIEPPAFGLALDDPAVAAAVARLAPVHAAAPTLSPEEFLRRFVAAYGEELPAGFTFAPAHRKGVEATRLSPDPASAPIAVESLAAARFPKLVASGVWSSEMETTCDRLATLIGAERALFPGTQHSPQRLGTPFNDRLRAVFRAAQTS
jgi:pimeloyl-ACP methyl ester carboxylesterase